MVARAHAAEFEEAADAIERRFCQRPGVAGVRISVRSRR